MANPSSRGIGTGTAQIFDTSNVDNALNNLANIKFRKDALYAEGLAKAENEKNAAIAELRGEFKDYDTNKLMLADVPEFQLKVQNINKKYDGKWGDILKGNPVLSNQYRADIDEVKRFIARSVDSKPKAQAHLKEIEGNPLYSEEYKKNYIERATSPNYNFDEDSRNGNLARDVARPDFMNNISSLFIGDGDELYDKKQVPYTGPDGKTYAEKSKVWKPEEEAFAKFKTTVGSDIEMMTDINLKYGDLAPEERVKAAYNDYKRSSEVYQKDITIRAAQLDKSSDKSPYSNISVTPYNLKGEQGVSIGGPKPLQPTNFSYEEGGKKNIMFGTPSEIFKDNDGNYKIRIVGKKETISEDGGISFVDAGTVKIIKVNEGGTAAAAFTNTYGKTPQEFYNEAYSGTSTEAKKDNLRNKYNY